MKKVLGFTLFLMFLCTGSQAQDFNLGDIIGEAQDYFGQSQNEAEKAADTEAQQKFEEAFTNKFKKWGEFSNNLDSYSPPSKCLYLMAKYIMELEALKEETEGTSDCKRKYDLYGMQLTSMMSSTSIMFCTEELFNEIDNIKSGTARNADLTLFKQIKKDFALIINKEDPTDFEKTMIKFYIDDTFLVDPYYKDDPSIEYFKIHEYLQKYFHPLSLMKEGMAISKEMDVLKPCTGY
ncbi:hypothetical protein [Allomuricauda sp. F6463D]|uniref:hypothetical protein n=1 Tax=Allomuricauda sp. F6463D TaxID=2926409 RepID=UPI001FF2198D|nr:hypothetical protein [Muricauda sp. F6463D]MCK0159980.1 hypothetical protein [Muricauda sp. F6463D]